MSSILFLRRLLRSYKSIFKMLGRVGEIYKMNDKHGRYNVCFAAVVLDALFVVLNIVLRIFAGNISFFNTCIFLGIIVLVILIFDLKNLKKYKDEERLNAREEAFLRAIAQEKGVNPITMKKYGTENSQTAVSDDNAAADVNTSITVKPDSGEYIASNPIPAPEKKKETLSDLPSAEEMAEME